MNNPTIDDIPVLMFACAVFLFGIFTFIYWRIKTSEEKRMKESARIAKERMIRDIKESEERTEKFFDNQETFLKDWCEHTKELREAGVFDDKLKDNAEYAKRGMWVGDRVTLEEADKLFRVGINEVTLISGETCYSPSYLEKIIKCNKKYHSNKIELQELHTKLRYGIKGE